MDDLYKIYDNVSNATYNFLKRKDYLEMVAKLLIQYQEIFRDTDIVVSVKYYTKKECSIDKYYTKGENYVFTNM